jgi:hypothetical protein
MAGRNPGKVNHNPVNHNPVNHNPVSHNPANRSRVKDNRDKVKPRTELNQVLASLGPGNRTADRPTAALETAVGQAKCTHTTDWTKAIANRYAIWVNFATSSAIIRNTRMKFCNCCTP